jgi:hypothetical protein
MARLRVPSGGVFGSLFNSDDLLLIRDTIDRRIRLLRAKASWKNPNDDTESQELRKLVSKVNVHLLVHKLIPSPVGVPPPGARGLGTGKEPTDGKTD